MPNSSSKRMTSSTVSSESAPRSSMKRALGVTSFSSTPSSSMIICLTFASISESAIILSLLFLGCWKTRKLFRAPTRARGLFTSRLIARRLTLGLNGVRERREHRFKARRVLDVARARLRRGLPAEPAQDLPRPDLDERPRAFAREKLHGLAPADGRRDLTHERVARLRAGSYQARVDVRHERHAQVAKLYLPQLGRETFLRRKHQRAVERRAHLQRNRALRAALFQQRQRALDRSRAPRDDDLTRRVYVRRAANFVALTRFGADGFNRLKVCAEYRGHRAHAHGHGLLHVTPALSHSPHGVRETQSARRNQRRILSETVARDERGARQTFTLGRAQRRDRSCENRGLRVLRQLQIFRGPLEAQLRQREA